MIPARAKPHHDVAPDRYASPFQLTKENTHEPLRPGRPHRRRGRGPAALRSIAREEIFGPVVAVIPYTGEAEAIRIANDSDYGLHGAVFTSDDDAALRVASAVRTGTFSVNSYTVNAEAPFGGVKSSGVGRDSGREAIESFTELKTVNLTPSLAQRLS